MSICANTIDKSIVTLSTVTSLYNPEHGTIMCALDKGLLWESKAKNNQICIIFNLCSGEACTRVFKPLYNKGKMYSYHGAKNLIMTWVK